MSRSFLTFPVIELILNDKPVKALVQSDRKCPIKAFMLNVLFYVFLSNQLLREQHRFVTFVNYHQLILLKNIASAMKLKRFPISSHLRLLAFITSLVP